MEDKNKDKQEPDKKTHPERPEIHTDVEFPVYVYLRRVGGRIVKRLVKTNPPQNQEHEQVH